MPLVIMCGTPVSGKTTRAYEIKDYFEKEHNKKVEIVSEDEAIVKLGYDKNSHYLDSQKEKRVRGYLKSEVIKLIGNPGIVILDGSNYIKGYRYELYCACKESKSTQCTIYTVKNYEEAWSDNKKREETEAERSSSQDMCLQEEDKDKSVKSPCNNVPYTEEVFTTLSQYRFEEPNMNNKWDSPLVTVQPEDRLKLEYIYSTLFQTRPPPPNMSTQNNVRDDQGNRSNKYSSYQALNEKQLSQDGTGQARETLLEAISMASYIPPSSSGSEVLETQWQENDETSTNARKRKNKKKRQKMKKRMVNFGTIPTHDELNTNALCETQISGSNPTSYTAPVPSCSFLPQPFRTWKGKGKGGKSSADTQGWEQSQIRQGGSLKRVRSRDQTPETNLRKRRCLDRSFQSEADLIAVITDRGLSYTPLQGAFLRAALEKNFTRYIDQIDAKTKPPGFDGIPHMVEGALRIKCDDEASMTWLRNEVRALPPLWEGAQLNVVPASQLHKLHKVSVFVPDFTHQSVEVLLTHLTRMNSSKFDMNQWSVFHHKILENTPGIKDVLLVIGAPRTEVDKLIKHGCRIHYKLGTLPVKMSAVTRGARE